MIAAADEASVTAAALERATTIMERVKANRRTRLRGRVL